ncbi:hypothetical protein UA08_07150 [Talaromyces atroroseus]|uniref:Uncharacterized protein n=1 Tax=Talaromyces atroroseus TaxID=1441469 RepID=A0A225AKA6_TALAT|nr:hypothetical protein UA08_07150 [Talaromyces atroroseus]OKL57648.1 hypothetical protein UA08_07150 [Talaromyces atroroseus]
MYVQRENPRAADSTLHLPTFFPGVEQSSDGPRDDKLPPHSPSRLLARTVTRVSLRARPDAFPVAGAALGPRSILPYWSVGPVSQCSPREIDASAVS